MLYSISNKQKYEKDMDLICADFHDSECINFNYDAANQKAEIYIDTYYNKMRYHWTFNNIKLFFATQFDVWGHSGKRLHEFNTIDINEIIPSLNNLKTMAYGNSKDILLSASKNLIGLHFLFISGNEVFIFCESINVEPNLEIF